jgi:spermidine/putrescine transport system ATP-binding protein
LATVALPGGIVVCAETEKPLHNGAAVSVAVRPEKVRLGKVVNAVNQYAGRVESVVYIGTDTQYDVRLPGDQHLRVREQNYLPGSQPLAAEGNEVSVSFSAEAARVLTD